MLKVKDEFDTSFEDMRCRKRYTVFVVADGDIWV